MTKTSIPLHVYEQFKLIVGEPYVITDESLLHDYGSDETEKLFFLPQVVLRPRTAFEISKIMQVCNLEKIPVTPRGAGTGLSGGALPHLGGVLISTDRLNTIFKL